jgi:hypothetical protein
MGMRICMLVILGFIMGIESLVVDGVWIGSRWVSVRSCCTMCFPLPSVHQ